MKKAAEIPQLDGGAEQEEVIKLIYQFDHQKGRGNRKVLEKNMRETMPFEIVRDILVNQNEEKRSKFGKKYNVCVTTLNIVKGKEQQVKWPETINGFLDITFLGKL